MNYKLTIVVILTICGCTTIPQMPAKPAGFVLAREYVDSIKYDSGDQYRKIQYGWDYEIGTAVIRTFDLEGVQLSNELHPEITLAANKAELEYAFSLVRKHPDLRDTAAQADARLYGGFAYRNGESVDQSGRHCLQKSRCIHVIISGGFDGEIPLGHAIVDLATGEVVMPKYNIPSHILESGATNISVSHSKK